LLQGTLRSERSTELEREERSQINMDGPLNSRRGSDEWMDWVFQYCLPMINDPQPAFTQDFSTNSIYIQLCISGGEGISLTCERIPFWNGRNFSRSQRDGESRESRDSEYFSQYMVKKYPVMHIKEYRQSIRLDAH